MNNTADINYFKDPLNGKTGETAFKEKLPSILESHEAQINQNIADINILETDKLEKGGYTGTANDIDKKAQLIDFNRYGKVWLPNDFPSLPFNLERKIDGKIYHDFNFDDLEIGSGQIYMSPRTGVDTNDGSLANPVSTLTKSLELAHLQANETSVINIKDNVVADGYFMAMHNINKNIIIKSISTTGRTILHTGQNDLAGAWSWVADGTAWKMLRSSVTKVFDNKYINIDSTLKPYDKMDTLAECQAKKGSWYTDNVYVWIRTIDDVNPDVNLDRFIIQLPKTAKLRYNIVDNKMLSFSNLVHYLESTTDDVVELRGTTSISNGSSFFAKNCIYSGARNSNGNGFGAININSVYSFNCISVDVQKDGFNYHDFSLNPTNSNFNFEYECIAYDCGADDITSSNNSTTCHDNMKILRVNSIGYNSLGPVLADVNACKSVNYDCVMHDSSSNVLETKSAYYFDTAGTTEIGYTYLFNCSGGGLDTVSVNSDNTQPLYIKNFKGKTPSCDYILLD